MFPAKRRLKGESSVKKRKRFELFCIMLIKRILASLGVKVIHTVVKKGRFSFGILVGVDICKILDEAIDRARMSECDIGVVTYYDICRKIVWLNSYQLNKQALVLENRNREFKLDNN
ncbi:5988_t:CDS:2, partial [Dentiscutata heterogama]